MWELYFITRLDALNMLFLWCMLLSIAASIAFIIFKLVSTYNEDCTEIIIANEYSGKEYTRIPTKNINKILRRVLISAISFIILFITIPTKKDMLYIYGLGTAIDYVQRSEEVKKLPDNTIKVLNKLCEDYLNEYEERKCESI